MAEVNVFDIGDTVIGENLHGDERSGIIRQFTEGTLGKFALLADGSHLRLETLRHAQIEFPAVLPATGEGEFYGTQPDPLPETLPAGTAYIGTDRVRVPAKTEARLRSTSFGPRYWARWSERDMDTHVGPEMIDWPSVRKSPPPPEDRDAGKTSSRPVSADAKPKAVGVSDPYRSHVNAVPDGAIAAVMAEQDLRYRKRVKELRLDMDRGLPRTWRDRMTGELVSFDGPVGKGDKR